MPIPKPFRPPKKRQLEEILAEKDKPVLLYFLEPSSNLCQLIEPSVVSTCQEHKDILEFIGARMKNFRDYFYEWHIHSCPAFLIFRNGEEIRRLTDIKFRNDFKERFRNFLIGEFLFSTPFETVDSVTFGHVINTGNYYHLVAFMKPGHPTNWKLKPTLEQLQAKHSSHLDVNLVNTTKAVTLMNKKNIDQLPTVILYQEGEMINSWSPAYNPQRLEEECSEIIS